MTQSLRVDQLYRFYRAGDEETLALCGVSLEVASGEVVAVVGPSGSGKSTLLSCVTGTDEPSGGTVWVGDQRMSHQPAPFRARLRADHIGIVSQQHNLFDHLTVTQNMRLVRRLSSKPGAEPGQLLDSLGLGKRADATPSQLSAGELARAGLAVALANDPQVLVADEPTGELDQNSEEAVLALLRQQADRGAAVLVASHSPAVRRAADRVLELKDGLLQP
jgi:putative ABC transport system ATP-binding protein